MKRALHTGGHDSPCGIPYVSVQDSPVLTDPHKLVGLRVSESVLIRTRESKHIPCFLESCTCSFICISPQAFRLNKAGT